MGSNSTLLKIDLSKSELRYDTVSILAQALGSRNKALQKLALGKNNIPSMGVGVLLGMVYHVRDIDLQSNYTIVNMGASQLASSLGNNALPNLTRLSLSQRTIDDDGFIVLMLAQKAFLALAESLPEIKVLQQLDFDWCTGLYYW
jgi:CheY-specific phosphatase CheX